MSRKRKKFESNNKRRDAGTRRAVKGQAQLPDDQFTARDFTRMERQARRALEKNRRHLDT